MTRFLDDLRPWRHGYDWFCLLYVLVTGFYPLLNPACFEVLEQPGPLHNPAGHLLVHMVLAAFIYVLPPWLRQRSWTPARLLGVIYVPFLFSILYTELGYLSVVFHGYGQSFDPLLIGLEQRIFGLQPSLEWSRAWPWPWFVELMEFGYFSYYSFAVVALVMIWFTGRRDSQSNWSFSSDLVRDLGAVMLTCYIWYVFTPVWGPKYFDYLGIAGSLYSEGIDGWVFAAIMRWIDAHGSLHGAAFPSSHVAGSMVSWWWGCRVAPRHRWWLTTLWILLCFSTVYGRYHYVLDVVAGIAWGAFIMTLTARLGRSPAAGLRYDP